MKNWFLNLFKTKRSASIDNIYTLNGQVPFFASVPYGLQHVLAMFVANIAPVMIVSAACGLSAQEKAKLIQTAMIIAGIGSLIQLFPIWRVGAKLPIVMGISFTFVSILCYVGVTYGYSAAIGAVMVGGVVEFLLGLFAKYWRRIISPIVAACVVTAIGFSLLSVGATSFGGGSGAADFGSAHNWILGTVTLIACICFNIFAKGPIKQLAVLFGLVVGYVTALVMGKVDFSALEGVSVVSLPQVLPYMPTFNISAIVSVSIIFLVSATETIGDSSALASSALGRDATDKEISGALACDGIVSTLSACFGCMPITSFSQNIGLVAMTKVINRFAIATGAGIMICAGIFPAVGAILATLPEAVLGGCTIMMFGTIVVSGLEMIGKCGFTQRNITIAALSLIIGIGFTQVPAIFENFPEILYTVFAENCVAVVFVTAIVLSLIMPKEKKENEIKKEEVEETSIV
ncbi:MAG: purine permease [Clostridia bacterium]|nr:purine permease [Clostridia bacterium]